MILAANLKVNHTREEIKTYINDLDQKLNTSNEIFVFPNMSGLDNYNTKNFTVGIQNAYPANGGAYTGEVCLDQLDSLGIKTILIGHSERRTMLSESNEFIKTKFDFFAQQNFKIIFCIGESLQIREKGINAVQEFLYLQLEDIDLQYPNLVVAYEPIWAIGTGMTASYEQVDETLSILRNKVSSPLLYGGSVNADNIVKLSNISNCDGVLIGGASNTTKSFLDIINAV